VEVAQEKTPQKNASPPTTKAVIHPPFLVVLSLNYLLMRLAFERVLITSSVSLKYNRPVDRFIIKGV